MQIMKSALKYIGFCINSSTIVFIFSSDDLGAPTTCTGVSISEMNFSNLVLI